MTTAKASEPQTDSDDEDGTSLLDIAIALAKHKRLLIGLPLLAAVVAAGLSLLLPNIYTATTRILPPQQSASTASALANQIGGMLGGLGGLVGSSVAKSPNDLYIGMLRSRTVADNLIGRYDLQKAFNAEKLSTARTKLAGKTTITSGKDGIIQLDFDDHDPARAAQIANAYVDELMKLTSVLAVTEASQRRLFFERQLAQAKDNLGQAEAAAGKALQQGGLLKVDERGKALVETEARLRGQISAKEVQIAAMRTFAAEGNPDLQKAQQELEALKREEANLEGGNGEAPAPAQASEKGLESLRLLRDVKYYETVYELLARQYEMAKIDEAHDSSMVQVIDKAVVPDEKSRPRRTFLVLGVFIGAVVVAMMLALLLEAMAGMSADPRHADRLARLRSHLRIGRRQPAA
jgi:uncharacterized protein involved in exopolysaccharide biosynthesis